MLQCDENTIIKIIDRHSNMIYRICFVYLKNKYDAEDAFQEVIIKLMERAPHFQNDQHEKAWIIKVSCNHCKNILNYNTSKKHVAFDEDIGLKTIDTQDNTLEHILNLPLHYRNVLYLYYYEGYSTKEIANILKRRDATIRTWLKRARETLKNIIGDGCDE
jgi:RNA polymerase sigma-70 factor (ECF subfamily)